MLFRSQLKVNAKTAREAIGAMNVLPAETLGELAKHTVAGLVESEQELLDVVIKQSRKAPIAHAEPKVHAATVHPKPKKRAATHRKPVAVTV